MSDKISIKTKNIKFVKSRKKVFLISKNKIKNLYNKIIYPIAKNNDLVLHSSYMGLKNDLLIQIKNKQVPFCLSNEDTIVIKFNIKFREDCKNRYFPKSQISFEGYLDKLLFSLLPMSFLESFKLNIDKTERLNWPKKPQIIFSANSFEYDDLFKIWAASKITKNSKIIFAQHGGNYGTNRFLANNTVEEQVADILTWGWTDNKKKKAFYFLKKTKKINNNKGKKLLYF